MNCKWSVIPNIKEIDGFLELSRKYGAAFEYNDFFMPSVYEDASEVKKRIDFYNSLDRNREGDTLHGVFFDVAFISTDSVIRNRSRELAEASLKTAKALSCKGVVFHAGLISGLDTEEYIRGWLDKSEEYLRELAARHSDIDIYIENTFEKTPDVLKTLMDRMSDVKNVTMCFDYAHAALTKTPEPEWFEALAPYIKHMHTNDNDLLTDLHLAVGDGSIDYNCFKSLVSKYVDDARILIEVTGYDKAARSLEYLENL